jgi:hypothetical protein
MPTAIRQLIGQPSRFVNPTADHLFGLLKQFQVEFRIETLEKIGLSLVRFQLVGNLCVTRSLRLVPLLAETIEEGGSRDGFEPGTEALPAIVLERFQLTVQLSEHLLGGVLRVGILAAPVSTPSVNPRAISLDEQSPGGLVCGV